MANLAMAIPSMQSGEPQGSTDDAIVTEKSFVQFANSFDKLSAKITVNKKKTQRVHERIDLMMERRARRLGQPERAKAEEAEREEMRENNTANDTFASLPGVVTDAEGSLGWRWRRFAWFERYLLSLMDDKFHVLRGLSTPLCAGLGHFGIWRFCLTQVCILISGVCNT